MTPNKQNLKKKLEDCQELKTNPNVTGIVFALDTNDFKSKTFSFKHFESKPVNLFYTLPFTKYFVKHKTNYFCACSFAGINNRLIRTYHCAHFMHISRHTCTRAGKYPLKLDLSVRFTSKVSYSSG